MRFKGLIVVMSVCSIQMVLSQQIVVKAPSDQTIPPPQLGISPPKFDEKIAEGKPLNLTLILYNYNPKPKQIELNLYDTDKNYQLIKPNESTLLPWTIINPTEFTIEGNGQQTIRISIRPPIQFPKKTHHAMIKIDQQVPDALKINEDNQGATITLGSSYGLPIIVNVE